ncbi:hypothetical protein [Fusicatenibacter sp.]
MKILAKAGDELEKDHYRKLELHAGECVSCGHCNKRCLSMWIRWPE